MRRTLLIGSTLLVLGCGSGSRDKDDPEAKSGPPGAASLDELRDRALAALRADDPEAYLELMASPAYLMKHCGEDPEYAVLEDGGEVAARGKQKRELNEGFAECGEAFDWAKATLDRVEGGEPKSSSLRCSPASEAFEDLVDFYQVGGKPWRVKVANDVYRVSGRYVVTDVPSCDQRAK